MVEHEQVSIDAANEISLDVDFKLFSIAIKNMIDNAIKYSPDKRVDIAVSKNSIKFISKGEKLKQELAHYIEPFTKGEDGQKSFGLGLYIVYNILKAHKLKLNYKYEDELNVFSFEGLENISH